MWVMLYPVASTEHGFSHKAGGRVLMPGGGYSSCRRAFCSGPISWLPLRPQSCAEEPSFVLSYSAASWKLASTLPSKDPLGWFCAVGYLSSVSSRAPLPGNLGLEMNETMGMFSSPCSCTAREIKLCLLSHHALQWEEWRKLVFPGLVIQQQFWGGLKLITQLFL